MQIGKAGEPVTRIAHATPDRVEVRGRDLTGDLMGRLSFTEYFHLLLTGREPTDDERFFLDLTLVAIAEHGLMPSNVAARMTLAADPESLQGAVAAGILGAGPVILGAVEECARLLAGLVADGKDALQAAEEIHAAGGKIPGFGHPLHRPVDPRAERILELADARGVSGRYVALTRAAARRGRRDVGQAAHPERLAPDRGGAARSRLPTRRREGRADPGAHREPARAPGRGARAADRVPARGQGRGGDRVSRSLTPSALPWAEQSALDDASFRQQLAYLRERSPFYREKLAGTDPAAGLEEIAQLPLTEKQEVKATCTPEQPFGAHFCVEPSELVRIYSTSGTTGAPSYIPLTANDLDNWVTGSARSYGASGISAGDRLLTTYNAGPFVAGAALDAFARIGVCHIPVGTGNSERVLRAIRELRPDAVAVTPSYAAYLLELGRGIDLRLERAADPRRRGARRRRARVPGGARGGLGARVTEAMGIGDIGPSLWGECEEQRGCTSARAGFVHAELIDPETGEPLELRDGARGELVLTHLRHEAAPLLRFRTRDQVEVWTGALRVRTNGATRPLRRPHRRHADRPRRQHLPVGGSRGRRRVRAGGQRAHSGPAAAAGVKQEPPLPVSVELAARRSALAPRRRDPPRLREVLVVQMEVELVPWGALQRSEYKSTLVEPVMRKLQTQGVHHITIVGAGRQTSIDFWEGVLGMPFVFEQPNLDNASESHLYFDPGDGRLITIFTNEERMPDPARTSIDRVASTTSRSRSPRRRSIRPSSGSTSEGSGTAASRIAGSWTRSTSRIRSGF